MTSLKVAGVTLYYDDTPFLEAHGEIIKRLARLQAVEQVANGDGIFLTGVKYKAWLDIPSHTAKAYAKELEGKVQEQAQLIKQLEGRLANKAYVSNAPKEVVEQTKKQLKSAQERLGSLSGELKRFG